LVIPAYACRIPTYDWGLPSGMSSFATHKMKDEMEKLDHSSRSATFLEMIMINWLLKLMVCKATVDMFHPIKKGTSANTLDEINNSRLISMKKSAGLLKIIFT